MYFNLLNKSILQHFPFPYTVSVVHVAVGTAYCTLTYLLGLKSWSFGRVCRQAGCWPRGRGEGMRTRVVQMLRVCVHVRKCACFRRVLGREDGSAPL